VYGLQGPTKKIPTSPFKTPYSSSKNQTNFMDSTRGNIRSNNKRKFLCCQKNIEQDQQLNQPLQQISDIQDFKDMMKNLFVQMA
jgi:hypothetical protein